VPLSFVVCVTDDAILQANLLASPCPRPGSPHEVILVRDATSAGAGLNRALERAGHELVVCVHQDVYLPRGWDRRIVEQYRRAEERSGPIGVAGVYGVGEVEERAGYPPAAPRVGWAYDRDRLLRDGPELPASVATLDEFVLVVRRDTPLRFDPELGFHLYGADLCLQARERGLAVVALGALCFHNSRSLGLPGAFLPGARAFARKWRHRLPAATPCVVFDGQGRMFLLGNAEPGGLGLARAVGEAIGAASEGGGPMADEARRVSPTRQGIAPPSPGPQSGLTSVIVPCWNQLEFTRECLRALFEHTHRPWELIVVDNGSTDGTGEFLAGVQAEGRVPIAIVRNERNRGYPAAVNQGLRVARGDYLVLLNNDAVVTEGWLEHLIALTSAPIDLAPDRKEPTAGDAEIAERDTESREREGVDEGRLAGLGIGLVGPMSNYASLPQLVEGVPYHDLNEMHAFAARWRADHRGRWLTAGKLSGFCLLMTRAVHDAIGGLDERFGLGFFDDDDLAERARRAGFGLALARDVFVHHFGSRTFVGGGIDAEGLLDENARKFAEKWGRDVPQGRRVALRTWEGEFHAETPRAAETQRSPIQDPQSRSPRSSADDPTMAPRSPLLSASLRPLASLREIGGSTGESAKGGRRARVSLTMIVRDEEENLPHCLQSVRGIFDEIIVVDTGSVDRTREIAREFGARGFDFVWVDDFAAARNAALARATGDYAFWLDADDVIEPPERDKLIALLEVPDVPEVAAYVVKCACDPGEDGSGGHTVVDHIRLFPVHEAIRWTYRVHEQILPALRRAHVPVRWTDLTVRHTGYTDRALRAKKLVRDARILRDELEERPDDPFALFNLGSIAIERQDWREALALLHRSLAGSAPTDSITRKLHALIARAHQMLGEPREALAACAAGLEADADDAELLFRAAVVRRQCGDGDGARRCWERILTLRRPEKFASVDQGIYGHLTRRNLAALAADRCDHDEAARQWRAILEECPGDPEALTKLDQLARSEVAR
jgi:glycosyltransferase involved in cell wall biosynthesis